MQYAAFQRLGKYHPLHNSVQVVGYILSDTCLLDHITPVVVNFLISNSHHNSGDSSLHLQKYALQFMGYLICIRYYPEGKFVIFIYIQHASIQFVSVSLSLPIYGKI